MSSQSNRTEEPYQRKASLAQTRDYPMTGILPAGVTHLHDLPDAILLNIFALVSDVRARNNAALVCRRWLSFERSTRTSLSLRGNARHLFFLPASFPAVAHLDLSLLSPYGHPHLSPAAPSLLARRLALAFPALSSLTLYARHPATVSLLAPLLPKVAHIKLVRWHQRPLHAPLGADFVPLLQHCPSLSSLDLSTFYFWTEDLPPVFQAHPSVAKSITRLNLLSPSCPEGFKSHELLAISAACPNLSDLLAACVFDPRHLDFVSDDTLLDLAENCSKLRLLHLADAGTGGDDVGGDVYSTEDAAITCAGLEQTFALLPDLEDLTLDLCPNVRDAGPAVEALAARCANLKSLSLGRFHGICRAVVAQADGAALCRGLESLAVKSCADLNDFGLIAIAQGCPRLAKFEIQSCPMITELGLRRFAGILGRTLADVKIARCKCLDAAASLRALEPIRDWLRRLHVDCVWDDHAAFAAAKPPNLFDLNELAIDDEQQQFDGEDYDEPMEKRRRYSEDAGGACSNHHRGNNNGELLNKCSSSSPKTWRRLTHLSLWIPVGELLAPLPRAGLESCPALEEVRIRVEGDCRRRPKPAERAFGLTVLRRYPMLRKMQLDCGDVIGYALTAPSGHMDLSLWERFYLNGIGEVGLSELDYWPPQDRDVNQRSLTLPAAGLLAQCTTLRKLFIHGTTHEHFMMFLLKIPNLRDVQLREDYYPAPENDMSTEMRVDSCSRFEDALNGRIIAD